MDIVKRVSNWYFSKKVLPYWVILLVDTAIVFASCAFAYWVSNDERVVYDNRFPLLYTALIYAVVSWMGARIFRTYSGVLRYSSFVDLLRLVYANLVSLALCLALCLVLRWQGVEDLSILSPMNVLVAFTVATFAMWIVRVAVKLLFDTANSDSQAIRVLIYGALTGGIGIANSTKRLNLLYPGRYTLLQGNNTEGNYETTLVVELLPPFHNNESQSSLE